MSNQRLDQPPLDIQRVLISDELDPVCQQVLLEAGLHVKSTSGLAADQLKQLLADYDALIVRSSTKVTRELIAAAAPRLRLIGRAGVGVDNIDCAAAADHSVRVVNAPLGNTLAAAELTCAMMLSLVRHVAQACASVRSGRWERAAFMGSELSGKTLGIVGLGRIGREVAVRMQAFGMRTLGFDPLVSVAGAAEFGVELVPTLEQLWPRVDFITLHVPLVAQTRDLINSSSLAQCRRGVRVINCARGGIVDQTALLQALRSGQCAGAALDVFAEEPPQSQVDRELVEHPRVVVTPHLGASSEEAQSRVAREIAEAVISLNKGIAPPGVIC